MFLWQTVHSGFLCKDLEHLKIIFYIRISNFRSSYLHNESLKTDSLVVVLVVPVELEVVVEDEAVLHVVRHLKADRRSA